MPNGEIIKRDELITSQEYQLGNIQYELYNDIRNYLDTHNMNQTEFANILDVHKSYVSQILNENFDHKISKLIKLYNSIGKIVKRIETQDIGEYLLEDKADEDVLELKQVDYLSFEPEPDREFVQLTNTLNFKLRPVNNESTGSATAA